MCFKKCPAFLLKKKQIESLRADLGRLRLLLAAVLCAEIVLSPLCPCYRGRVIILLLLLQRSFSRVPYGDSDHDLFVSSR